VEPIAALNVGRRPACEVRRSTSVAYPDPPHSARTAAQPADFESTPQRFDGLATRSGGSAATAASAHRAQTPRSARHGRVRSKPPCPPDNPRFEPRDHRDCRNRAVPTHRRPAIRQIEDTFDRIMNTRPGPAHGASDPVRQGPRSTPLVRSCAAIPHSTARQHDARRSITEPKPSKPDYRSPRRLH